MRHRHGQVRWLHARISETLEGALKREARRRRQPVSLLVRNVLEGALDLVEDIVESSLGVTKRSEHVARHLHRHRPDAARQDAGVQDAGVLADVYGWQEIILNRPASCSRCETGLGGGAPAFRGLRDDAGPAVFLCPACIRRLRQPASHEEGSR